jgi:hypothetical protein
VIALGIGLAILKGAAALADEGQPSAAPGVQTAEQAASAPKTVVKLKWLPHQASPEQSAEAGSTEEVSATDRVLPAGASSPAAADAGSSPDTLPDDPSSAKDAQAAAEPAVPKVVVPSPSVLVPDAAPIQKAENSPSSGQWVPAKSAAPPAASAAPSTEATTPNALEELTPPSPLQLTEKCKLPREILKSINKITADIEAEKGEFPPECAVSEPQAKPTGPIGDRIVGNWRPVTFTWTASATSHKPLYFEEVQLERYGHTWGPVLQPIVSSAHFFAVVPLLPYLMGMDPPGECQYTLGYYRPGNCAPYMLDPFPISVRGALAEAGAWTAGVFIF